VLWVTATTRSKGIFNDIPISLSLIYLPSKITLCIEFIALKLSELSLTYSVYSFSFPLFSDLSQAYIGFSPGMRL
jgi:hypothetical protein